jgi:hypothetical protein
MSRGPSTSTDEAETTMNRSPDSAADRPSGRLAIRRRDFLALSGAAALYPAFEGIARAQEVVAGADVVRPMSVGYVEGSDTWKSFKAITAATLNRGVRSAPGNPATAANVVPATSLIAGDQSLANQTVRMGVHGLYPIPNPTAVRAIYLTVFFPSDNPGLAPGPLPFTAWGYKSRPAPDPGAPVKFVAPLGPTGELDLLLEVTPGNARGFVRRPSSVGPQPGTPGGRFTTRFTVDWLEGRPRMQRGLYLLGLAPSTWLASRTLPVVQPGQSRPVELVSLLVSFEPIPQT